MSALALESTRRLADLLRREHAALGDFLVALADFDRQRLWEPLGHTGLFYFLHRELGLSKGAAHYRKVAAGLVQRFPEVVAPLRDGRLCITSVVELARVMTEANRAEVLPRFFHRSKAEARAVAVELRPEAAPRREVITLVHPGEPAGREGASRALAPTPISTPAPAPAPTPIPTRTPTETSTVSDSPSPLRGEGRGEGQRPSPAPTTTRAQVEPLTAELRRLHVTVSRRFLEKLEAARAARSHAQPGASAEEILEAGLDLLLARQASRRGLAMRPRVAKQPRTSTQPATSNHATTGASSARTRPLPPPGPEHREVPTPTQGTGAGPVPRPHVPSEVRREVWRRDEGRCTWPLAGGGRCGVTHQVEIDHVVPHARGGPAIPGNLRLLCRFHNLLAARQAFGEVWMGRFHRRGEAGADVAPEARQRSGGHLTAPAPAGPPPCGGG